MTELLNKRQLRRDFKEKKTPRGIYTVRCAAAGLAWAGASTHLNSERNSLWFQLRNGSHLNRKLQEVWNAHGEAAFEFAAVETLDEDVNPLLVKDLLREKLQHWAKEMGATI